MKKNIIVILIMCLVLVTATIYQASAIEPRNYFSGCRDCGGVVDATCAGIYPGSPFTITHEYGGFLWWDGEICSYIEHIHYTTETCRLNSAHIHPGDDVHSIRGHDCGEPDAGDDPCPVGAHSYTSINQ